MMIIVNGIEDRTIVLMVVMLRFLPMRVRLQNSTV